ncbi:MAG: hypothetical protein LBG42_07695 [Treponema sp.]|jgi:hypothetical protein|nr:hypothetical protein [Treponema sp.]
MTEIEDTVTAAGESRQEHKRQRDLLFRIPSRIILNERGTSFFIAHGKSLHCFETADGERHFGFHLERTGFSWLKKLISNNYLRKIEIQVKDISACRVQLEDAVKLVFFSMFRQRINMSILGYIYDSPMVRAWNRANPKRSIGPGIKIAKKSFEELLNSRAPGRIGELMTELYHRTVKSLPRSFVEQREDARELGNFIAELVSGINPLVFFVLAGSKHDDMFTLMQTISLGIIAFVHRFDIASLAALLAIELVSAAERSALVRLLENTGNITGILENPERRKSIMKEKRFRGSTVVVSVPPEIPRENQRVRFRISVHNDGADAETERKLMEDFTERSFSFRDGKDLDAFFRTPPSRRENSIYEDNGLCFYHLSTLREQCTRNRILMDTAIKNAHSGKSVVTSLWFGF